MNTRWIQPWEAVAVTLGLLLGVLTVAVIALLYAAVLGI